MTVAGDRMTLDFSRSAKACQGPVNIARSTTVACCYVALKHVFTEVPANAGVLDPIDFVIPEDSLLSVTWPKPVGGYTETILRLLDIVFSAVAKADPARSTAHPYGPINALSLAGPRPDGRPRGMVTFLCGGPGGHPDGT